MVALTGEIVTLYDDRIDLRTSLGLMTMSRANVECEGAGCPPEPTLSQTVNVHAPQAVIDTVLEPLAISYARGLDGRARSTADRALVIAKDEEKLITLSTKDTTSGAAVQALLDGETDLIVINRRMTDAETKAFVEAGLGNPTGADFETVYGQDAVVFVVHENNPVRSLTLEQVSGIYSGQITNWSQFGGPDLAIRPMAPLAEDDLSQYVQRAVLDNNRSQFSNGVERLNEGILIDEAVSRDPSAIGVISNVDVGLAKQLSLSSSCGIKVGPESFAVRAGDYPLTRRLYAYRTNRSLPSHGGGLLSLLQSDDGQAIVQASGYTSLETEAAGLDRFGSQLAHSFNEPAMVPELDNLRAFLGEVLGAQRLSTTFRFSSGSAQLEQQNRSEAIRLAALLRKPAYSGTKIKLVGFTDSVEHSDVDDRLSHQRAAQVLDEIVAASAGQLDIGQFEVHGYGAAHPSACNSDVAGRRTNRRVEVWVQ